MPLPEWLTAYLLQEEYLRAAAVFAVAILAFKLFQSAALLRLQKLASKTKTDLDDALIDIVSSIRPPFYFFLALYVAARMLPLPPFALQAANALFIAVLIYQAVATFQAFVNHLVRRRMGEEDRSARSALSALGTLAKIVLWTVGVLLILSNFGVNITALAAGLGIGGVAIAFALQSILSDLFSSFALYFDKPFVPGDFIVVGEHMGTVEKIGIKTTRIRALQGEEVVISNNELTSSRIQNFKRMKERRIVFSFGVTYDTSPKKLERIPELVKEVVDREELARFDRAHFHRFGDSSLDFEAVYYVETGDYNRYMDVNQAIHLGIKQAFDKEGIEFAFPTRTVHLAK